MSMGGGTGYEERQGLDVRAVSWVAGAGSAEGEAGDFGKYRAPGGSTFAGTEHLVGA